MYVSIHAGRRFRAFVAESSDSHDSLSGVVEVSLQSKQVQKSLQGFIVWM